MKNKNMNRIFRVPLIPGIVELKSNIDYIYGFPLGMHLFPIESSFKGEIIAEFYVENEFKRPADTKHIFGPYFISENGKDVYMERKLVETKLLGDSLKIRGLAHITDNGLKFIVNNLYIKLIRFQLGDWFPPAFHFFDLIQSKLLLNGKSILHSACISSAEDSILILAKPDTGKTSTVFELTLTKGWYLLSEDLTVVDNNGFAYSCPYTSTYFNNKVITHKILKKGWLSSRDRMRIMLNKLLPPIPLLSSFGCRSPSPSMVLQKIPRRQYTKIKKIVFLERNHYNSIERVDNEVAFKKLIFLNRAELRYYRDPMIVALSYYNEEYNIEKLLSIESRILSSLIDNVQSCYVIRANSPLEFVKFIETLQER